MGPWDGPAQGWQHEDRLSQARPRRGTGPYGGCFISTWLLCFWTLIAKPGTTGSQSQGGENCSKVMAEVIFWDPVPMEKHPWRPCPYLASCTPRPCQSAWVGGRQAGALTKAPWQDFNKKWQNHRKRKEWSCTLWSIFESKINKLSLDLWKMV